MAKEMYKELDKTIFSSINSGLNSINHENKTFKNINEMQNQLSQNKLNIENQLNDLKTKGETEVYDIIADITCNNGSIFYDVSSLNVCNDGLIKSSVNKGYKKFKTDGKNALILIAADSMLLTLTENMLWSYQNLLSSKKDIDLLTSQTLETLDYSDKKIYYWQAIRVAILDITRNNQSLLYKNPQKVIINLENFIRNYKTTTVNEIESVNINDKCLEIFNNIRSKENPDNQFSSFKKSMPKNNLLFIKVNFDVVCKNFENIKKEQAIKILKSIENEKNPFVAIEDKLYPNLFVECNNEWFSLDYKENKLCMGALKKELADSLQTELNKN